MKKLIFLLFIIIPVLVSAQGHKGDAKECAPMKDGKVCYTDTVEMDGMSQIQLFDNINTWAKKTYGKDVFISNVVSNKNKSTIFITSKVELLLNEKEKTILKYKLYITCMDGKYIAEAKNITYLYDPQNDKKFKTYTAEDVIANNGKSNTVAIIKDPKLFCNATFFFIESLFADVYGAADPD